MTIKYLVFSGGGPNGLSQFGAIKKFLENFVDLKNIEGIYATSIGTILGILLSIDADLKDIEDYLINKNWSKSFLQNTNDVLSLNENKGLINHAFAKEILDIFYKSKDIDTDITFKNFYELTGVKLHFYSIKLTDYAMFEFSYENTPDMPVYLASLASCSIPPVFGPILYADDYYIDGGFLNNYPVNSCLNSSKCAKEEILGIRVKGEHAFEYKDVEKDNFPTYLCKIMGDLIGKNMTDDTQEKIPFSLFIKTAFETTNVKLWENFANNIEFREEQISMGYNLADEFLKNLE